MRHTTGVKKNFSLERTGVVRGNVTEGEPLYRAMKDGEALA